MKPLFSAGSAVPRVQRGFAIVSAIFLLVVLAGIMAYMVTLTGVQHATSLMSTQGERAHYAARSGIEWAISDLVNRNGAGLNCGPGAVVLNLTQGALAGFAVTIQCSSTAVTEGTTTYNFHALKAFAVVGSAGQPGFAQRQLEVSVAL